MIERVLDAWRRIDDVVAVAERWTVFILMMVMTGAIFAETISFWLSKADLIGRALFGATELATVLLLWVGLMSASLATRARKHIVVDAIPRALGDRPRTWILNGVIYLITAAFLIWITTAAWSYYRYAALPRFEGGATPSTVALNIPLAWAYLGFPISMAVMGVRFLQISLEELAAGIGWYPAVKRRIPEGLEQALAALKGDAPAAEGAES